MPKTLPGKLRPQIRRRMEAAGFHKEAEMTELVSVVEGIIKEGIRKELGRQKDVLVCTPEQRAEIARHGLAGE